MRVNTRYINSTIGTCMYPLMMIFWGCTSFEDVPLGWSLCTLCSVTGMPDESYRGRLKSLLLYLCSVFRALELTPLCVDSARALWASFCFRFLVRLSHSLVQAWLSVYRSLPDYRSVSVCLPYYQCTHELNIYVHGCKRLEFDLLRKVAVNL